MATTSKGQAQVPECPSRSNAVDDDDDEDDDEDDDD